MFYADESGISTEGYVPYGWMQRGEKIGVRVMPVSRQRLNCFGLLSRNGNFHYTTTEQKADSDFVIGWMDAFSLSIEKETVVVLDNAPIHKSKKMLAMKAEWQERGLHLFYLPPYSPHLNIIETLWRVLKGKWLEVSHYASAEKLFQAAKACLEEIGDKRKINFSKPT